MVLCQKDRHTPMYPKNRRKGVNTALRTFSAENFLGKWQETIILFPKDLLGKIKKTFFIKGTS